MAIGSTNNPQWQATTENVDKEHMRILEEAVADCEDYDIRTAAVYNSLDHFENRSTSTWGFSVFRQGLEQWSPMALYEGLRLIKQHIGYTHA